MRRMNCRQGCWNRTVCCSQRSGGPAAGVKERSDAGSSYCCGLYVDGSTLGTSSKDFLEQRLAGEDGQENRAGEDASQLAGQVGEGETDFQDGEDGDA